MMVLILLRWCMWVIWVEVLVSLIGVLNRLF